MNSIFTIRPEKKGSVWVFTEPKLDVFDEPFCGQVNDIIDSMLLRANLPASEPFTALFSANRFPAPHLWLQWQREESDGNWYHDETTKMQGWLCPVLCKFFETAPKNIYVRAES